MVEYDSYVICTSPRSGSTLLCKLLAATGIAGNPDSYFHSPSISKWLSSYNLAAEVSTPERSVLNAIFKAAIAKGSLDTGMFGLRMQRRSFSFFSQKLAVLYPGLSNDTQRFQAAFGRTAFIYLTRLDKVQQAVSYVKAEQSGLWHIAPDGTELERLSAAQVLTYDPDAIGERLEEFTAYDSHWESWFVDESIDPFRLTYEALSAHPKKTLSRTLGHLDLACDDTSGVEPGVAKLADETSEDWVARFRAEYPNP